MHSIEVRFGGQRGGKLNGFHFVAGASYVEGFQMFNLQPLCVRGSALPSLSEPWEFRILGRRCPIAE